jgi:hypothetical protein
VGGVGGGLVMPGAGGATALPALGCVLCSYLRFPTSPPSPLCRPCRAGSTCA